MNEKEKKYGEIWLTNNPQSKPLRYEILPNGCYKVVGRKVDREGRCFVGAGSKNKKLAHRAVWEYFNGQIPDDLYILHSCDFQGCVNINHMRLGTIAENNRERSERGRNKVQKKEYVEPDISFTVNMDSNSSYKGKLDIKIDRKKGCWNIVNRVPFANGYHRVKYKGKTILAHRFMYERFKGQIPENYVIRHKCHNKSCCAPHHLEIGTQKENMQDTVKDGLSARGSANATAKLTELQALFIRTISPLIKTSNNLDADLTQKEVADWFNISSKSKIGDIINNKAWKHLPTFEQIRDIWRELMNNDNGAA